MNQFGESLTIPNKPIVILIGDWLGPIKERTPESRDVRREKVPKHEPGLQVGHKIPPWKTPVSGSERQKYTLRSKIADGVAPLITGSPVSCRNGGQSLFRANVSGSMPANNKLQSFVHDRTLLPRQRFLPGLCLGASSFRISNARMRATSIVQGCRVHDPAASVHQSGATPRVKLCALLLNAFDVSRPLGDVRLQERCLENT